MRRFNHLKKTSNKLIVTTLGAVMFLTACGSSDEPQEAGREILCIDLKEAAGAGVIFCDTLQPVPEGYTPYIPRDALGNIPAAGESSVQCRAVQLALDKMTTLDINDDPTANGPQLGSDAELTVREVDGNTITYSPNPNTGSIVLALKSANDHLDSVSDSSTRYQELGAGIRFALTVAGEDGFSDGIETMPPTVDDMIEGIATLEHTSPEQDLRGLVGASLHFVPRLAEQRLLRFADDFCN